MPISFWILFIVVILVLVFIDLAVINRQGRVLPFKRALLNSASWIALALLFALIVYRFMSPGKALEFVTGYLVEEALSVDNLFVFLLLFAYFKVPPEQERQVLAWGILGALLMRGAFIFAGVTLVSRFHWILYLLGAFLIYSGFQLMLSKEASVDPSRNAAVRFARRFLPVADHYDGGRFFTLQNGKRLATPLFIALLVMETTDIVFATDSIPAILAITRDPFIVFSSNVFAILGLRSLFFVLASLMKLFNRLNIGLAIVLILIGAKMLVSIKYEIPTWIVLATIATVLAGSVLASILFPEKAKAERGDDGSPADGNE
ncbi:MAG TPA: TerC family protein [Candidatus Angelobacter sp.]|jgi:tellurite resistance protein TerC|nr:TerC family protein [Candidatus Angelobacter sp.]